jgi:hypothetical protein
VYVVKQRGMAKEQWRVLEERPLWLAAVRRSGAMAARAVHRQRRKQQERSRGPHAEPPEV